MKIDQEYLDARQETRERLCDFFLGRTTFMLDALGESIKRNKEGCCLFCASEEKFFLGELKYADVTGCQPKKCPKSALAVGSFHTHTKRDPTQDNNRSAYDMLMALTHDHLGQCLGAIKADKKHMVCHKLHPEKLTEERRARIDADLVWGSRLEDQVREKALKEIPFSDKEYEDIIKYDTIMEEIRSDKDLQSLCLEQEA